MGVMGPCRRGKGSEGEVKGNYRSKGRTKRAILAKIQPVKIIEESLNGWLMVWMRNEQHNLGN